MADDIDGLSPFPQHGLIPKKETGAERFLTRFPEYDGRGVVIAIMDTGVDPAANGLQTTPDGRPKVIDLVDTSGSGDVDMTTIRTTHKNTANRIIEGITGRKLKIPDEWTNPTNKWHIGIKAAHDLFPAQLRTRLQKKFIEKEWNPVHIPLLAAAERAAAEIDKSPKKSTTDWLSQLKREDVLIQADLLASLGSKGSTPGPVYDCLVFHDGESWNCVVDTTESGDLKRCTLMKPYKESRQYSHFGPDDQFTYSINIYDEGKILSIVTNGGSHGTHVATIAAGYFPEAKERNGLAPGAQVIGLKIGDSRLSTMETAVSMIRACSVVAKSRCDLVNFSYGEASHWTNKGSVLEQLTSLVRREGVIFVSSAGNNGPAMSSVGCPGGNTDGLIGVGAYATPSLMGGAYSLQRCKQDTPYNWSSNGPSTDGDLGVSIIAPGAAYTSVPNWTLHNSQLMNGTSMSSPNACGNIALLLSSLKFQSISYTPSVVKRTIENTAIPMGPHPPWTIGRGIIQVDKAYERFMEIKDLFTNMVEFKISVTGLQGHQSKCRGIYLREPHHLKRTSSHAVSIEPCFHDDAPPQLKLDFTQEIALIPTQPWIHPPKHIIFSSSMRMFHVTISEEGLEAGPHYGEVCGYSLRDSNSKGPLFRVPVTIIIPHKLDDKMSYECPKLDVTSSCGPSRRFFFHVPSDATWADITITSLNKDKKCRLYIHTVQLLSEKAYRENETNDLIHVEPEAVHTIIAPVLGNHTLEVCLIQHWSDLNPLHVSFVINFHSLVPSSKSISLHSSVGWTRLDVTGNYRLEDLQPEVRLTHYCQPKRPIESTIRPLGERDVLPDGRQLYELRLTYNFHMNKPGEVRVNPTTLSDLLYESPYYGQLWMIYNHHKQLMGCGDAYSKNYNIKLEKGDHTAILQVRHDSKGELESLKDMSVMIEVKMSSHLVMDVGSGRCGQNKWGQTTPIRPGSTLPVYLFGISDDKVGKMIGNNYHIGDVLIGYCTLSKSDLVKKKVHYPVQYILGVKSNKTSTNTSNNSTAKPKKKTKSEEYIQAYKDFRLQWMSKGHVNPAELEDEFNNDIDYLMGRLKLLEGDKEIKWKGEVQELSSRILSQLDVRDVLVYQGTKVDLSQDASDRSSSLDKQRSTLIDLRLLETSFITRDEPMDVIYLEEIYNELHKILDGRDNRLRSFKMKVYESVGCHGLLAKCIEEEMNDKGTSKGLEEKLIRCYRRLGWEHVARIQERWLTRKYPVNYQPF